MNKFKLSVLIIWVRSYIFVLSTALFIYFFSNLVNPKIVGHANLIKEIVKLSMPKFYAAIFQRFNFEDVW